MTAQERQVIENKISDIKKELQEVHGTKCEVYSRVVGYLRPVQGWNKGKKEEYTLRRTYNVENAKRPCDVCQYIRFLQAVVQGVRLISNPFFIGIQCFQ